ncbi:GNAT family N-acetyltransferase [Streptomyces sp. NPDC050738]|uniref:GNAT family N-acetyltransferase n=1 Tax=Streptomyces sp. NPDC050738 TaxID=3154744 RepID=UPI00342F8E05
MPLLPMHTERLDLLPLEVGFAEEMAGVLADPELPVEALRARYVRQVAGAPEPGVEWWNWVIRLREEGRLVGYVQATVVARTVEVAWVVGEPWQRRGIASEAAGELVGVLTGEAGVRKSGVREVIAHIDPANVASGAVARGVGLAPTDETHDGEVRWRLVVA